MPLLSWWGRWDLNPGSPAPQAGILDQARLRPLSTRQRPSGKILTTLIRLKSAGLAESLQAYLKGLMFSSAVMLGVASEEAFLALLETFTNALTTPQKKLAS